MNQAHDPILNDLGTWLARADEQEKVFAGRRAAGLIRKIDREVRLALSQMRRTRVPYAVAEELTGWARGSLINSPDCPNVGTRGDPAFALGDLPFRAGHGTASSYVNPLRLADQADPNQCPLVAVLSRWAERAAEEQATEPDGVDALLLPAVTHDLIRTLNALESTPVPAKLAARVTGFAGGSLANMPGVANVGTRGAPEYALGQLPFKPGRATPGKLYLAFNALRQVDAVAATRAA